MVSHNSTEKTSYEEVYSLCSKAYKRHGGILDLPVGKEPYDFIKELYHKEYEGGRMLDFGCGVNKPMRKFAQIPHELYFTCDEDPGGDFNYNRVTDIPDDELFDVIVSNHVFEHLTFDVTMETAKGLAKHLKPGGIFMISVPNPSHPVRHHTSPFHVTPLNFMFISSILEMAGLDPYYCARSNKFAPPKWYIRPLINVICRTFRIDWCDGIYVVGRPKP